MSFRLVAVLGCVLGVAILFGYTVYRGGGQKENRLSNAPVVSTADIPVDQSSEARSVVPTGVLNSTKVQTSSTKRPLPSETADTARDLFALYLSARHLPDASLAYEAAVALRECAGLHGMRNDIQVAMAGGGGLGSLAGPMPPERADAAAEVLRRCQGFGRMSDAELRAERRAVLERAASLGSIEAQRELLPAEQKESLLKRSELRSILADPSPASIDVAARTLAVALNSKLPDTMNDEARAGVAGTAALLALCDITNACLRDSWGSLISCTFGSRCGKSKMEGWESALDTESQQLVNDLRAKTISAVRTGNWAFLGL